MVRRTFLFECDTFGKLSSPLRKVVRDECEKMSSGAKLILRKNLMAARFIEMLEAEICAALSERYSVILIIDGLVGSIFSEEQ